MAYSYSTYTGDGSNRVFSIPFPYIAQSDIRVEVNGVDVTFTFLSSSSVQTTVAPAAGATVTVRRETARATALVDFADGATLTATNLDDSVRQTLFSVQEIDDNTQDAINRAEAQSGLLPSGSSPADDDKSLWWTNGAWTKRTPAEARAHIGLVIGTGNGHIPQLGATGLPAVSGQNLTNVVHAMKYVRLEERKAYNVGGGAYGTGSSWIVRPLTHVVNDEVGGIALDGSSQFQLPAGTYQCRIKTTAMYIEHVTARLRNWTAGVDVCKAGPHFCGGAGAQCSAQLIGDSKFTIGATSTFSLDIIGLTASANVYALGLASLQSTAGDNIYSTVELWKLE